MTHHYLKEGDPAPEFTLRNQQNKNATPMSSEGKGILHSFRPPWPGRRSARFRCGPWRLRNPSLKTWTSLHTASAWKNVKAVAKTVYASDKTVKEVVAEEGLLPDDLIQKLFENP